MRQIEVLETTFLVSPSICLKNERLKDRTYGMKQAALNAFFATLIATALYAGLSYFLNYGVMFTQAAIHAAIFFGFMTIAKYVRSRA